MYIRTTAALIAALALVAAAIPVSAEESTQTAEYVGSTAVAGVAFCGLIGEGVASACFTPPSGAENVTIEIDDETSGAGVLIRARILAPSGNVDSATECGSITMDGIPADATGIYVWIYGAVDSLAASCGTGGVQGTVTATFA